MRVYVNDKSHVSSGKVTGVNLNNQDVSLWHIFYNGYEHEPYNEWTVDEFVWSDHRPTVRELKNLFMEIWDGNRSIYEEYIHNFLEEVDISQVSAYNIDLYSNPDPDVRSIYHMDAYVSEFMELGDNTAVGSKDIDMNDYLDDPNICTRDEVADIFRAEVESDPDLHLSEEGAGERAGARATVTVRVK